MSSAKRDNTKKVDNAVNGLMVEIVDEAKKLAKNETTSCYDLIEKTKELLSLEKFSQS